MKRIKIILLTAFLLFTQTVMASEYYALIIGLDNNEKILMNGTCYEFPLNKYVDTMDSKSKLLEKYISKDKLDYLKIDITYNDDFYKKRQVNSLIQRECLKDPEILKKYLANLWFYISTNKQKMIDDKIFTDKDEIDEFIAPLMTLIGIMSVATEMNCKKVTWITMKY
jgi:hypothetical protein